MAHNNRYKTYQILLTILIAANFTNASTLYSEQILNRSPAARKTLQVFEESHGESLRGRAFLVHRWGCVSPILPKHFGVGLGDRFWYLYRQG